MLSLFAHALYSAAIGLNTRAHISPSGPWSQVGLEYLGSLVHTYFSSGLRRIPQRTRRRHRALAQKVWEALLTAFPL